MPPRKKPSYTVEQIAKWALCSEDTVRQAINALQIPYRERRQLLTAANGRTCTSRNYLSEKEVHAILRKLYSNRREKVLPAWRRILDDRLSFELTLADMTLKDRRRLFARLEKTCCAPPKEG